MCRGLVLSLLLLTCVLVRSSVDKTSVHLHAILPYHFAAARELESAFLPSFLQYRRQFSYARVFRVFHTSGNVSVLRHDDPREILTMLCRDVLGAPTVTLVTINNPSLSERPSANRYVLDLAHSLGLPVISWDAQFSGSPKVSV